MLLFKVMVIVLSIYTLNCAPRNFFSDTLKKVNTKLNTEIKNVKDLKVNAIKYLFKYGYQDSYDENLPDNELAGTIKSFQYFANLPLTGKLDTKTVAQMALDRCGIRDPKIKITTRNRRYVHQGSSWKPLFERKRREGAKRQILKWTLINSGSSLRFNTVLIVMRQAFRYWQEKTNIDFEEIPKHKVGTTNDLKEENIEILVKFVQGWHQDPYAFDGQGGTLAHAFYPLTNAGLSGDVHFDDAERYTYKSPQGRNLLWVATHELGHSLGLEHSNVREAVMYPWYSKYKPGFKLHDDDVLGIQTLYGPRENPLPDSKTTTTRSTTRSIKTTTRRPTTTTTTTKKTINYYKRCPTGGSITALYYSRQYKQHIAFSTDNKIYLLGYKRNIPVIDRFGYLPRYRIPGKVSAVYTTTALNNKEEQVYFSGSKYHIYKDFKYVSGPHSIYSGSNPLQLNFPTWVREIDAAMTWYRNGRTYFFSGSFYWRYDNKNKRIDSGYPKKIKQGWRGLSSKIDTAYSSATEKKTYFISGTKYYEFDDRNIRVNGVYDVNRFMQCNGAAAIQVIPVGGLSIKSNVSDP